MKARGKKKNVEGQESQGWFASQVHTVAAVLVCGHYRATTVPAFAIASDLILLGLGTIYCGSGDYRETCHADSLGISFVLLLASLLRLAFGDDSLAAPSAPFLHTMPISNIQFPSTVTQVCYLFTPAFLILHKLISWVCFVVR